MKAGDIKREEQKAIFIKCYNSQLTYPYHIVLTKKGDTSRSKKGSINPFNYNIQDYFCLFNDTCFLLVSRSSRNYAFRVALG